MVGADSVFASAGAGEGERVHLLMVINTVSDWDSCQGVLRVLSMGIRSIKMGIKSMRMSIKSLKSIGTTILLRYSE